MQPTPRRVGALVAGIAILFLAGIGYRAFVHSPDTTSTTAAPESTSSTASSAPTTDTSGPDPSDGDGSTTSTSLVPLVSASLQPVAAGLGQPTYALAPLGRNGSGW